MNGTNQSTGSFSTGYNPWLLKENYNGGKKETEGMRQFRFIKAMHFYQLYNIAVNRYRYINLPKEIHPYVMEDYLVRNGIALLAFDDMVRPSTTTLKDGREGAFVATQVRVEGELDVYGFGDQRVGYSFGAQGYEKRFGKKNSVLMRDKPIAFPVIYELECYADKIANLWMTGDLNITALRMPFIGIATDDDEVRDLENLFKDVYSFAKFVKCGIHPVNNNKFNLFNTGAPVIFDKIESQILQVKYAALGSLGVECTPRDKKERIQSAEVDADMGAVESYRNIGLDMRERSMDQFNELFEPEKKARVEYNSDLPSIVNGFLQTGSIGGFNQDRNVNQNKGQMQGQNQLQQYTVNGGGNE